MKYPKKISKEATHEDLIKEGVNKQKNAIKELTQKRTDEKTRARERKKNKGAILHRRYN
jgi:hypothetical protein